MRRRVWAVLPVKPFGLAKQRLAGFLAKDERRALARAMFEDVLTVTLACQPWLAGVVVVTADHEAAEMAGRAGTEVVLESAAAGLNTAIDRAVSRVERHDPDAGMMVVPADVPQLRPHAIRRVVDTLHAGRGAALVRAIEDDGTNLLACRPLRLVSPCFGPGSFARHRRAARLAGIEPVILHGDALARDVDRPADVLAFLEQQTETRTHTFLSGLDLESRLASAMRRSVEHPADLPADLPREMLRRPHVAARYFEM